MCEECEYTEEEREGGGEEGCTCWASCTPVGMSHNYFVFMRMNVADVA